MLGGDPGDQRLCSVASGDPEQVRSVGDRLAGQGRHIYLAGAFQQRHLGAQRLGLLFQAELGDLPAARPRVHDHERARGRRDFARWHGGGGGRGQRQPGGANGQRQQHDRHHRYPDHVTHGEHHQHRDRDQDHQAQRQLPQHPAVGEVPVPARRYQAGSDRPDGHGGQGAPGMPFRESDQDRGRGKHQHEGGPGQPASAHDLARHRRRFTPTLPAPRPACIIHQE